MERRHTSPRRGSHFLHGNVCHVMHCQPHYLRFVITSSAFDNTMMYSTVTVRTDTIRELTDVTATGSQGVEDFLLSKFALLQKKAGISLSECLSKTNYFSFTLLLVGINTREAMYLCYVMNSVYDFVIFQVTLHVYT